MRYFNNESSYNLNILYHIILYITTDNSHNLNKIRHNHIWSQIICQINLLLIIIIKNLFFLYENKP